MTMHKTMTPTLTEAMWLDAVKRAGTTVSMHRFYVTPEMWDILLTRYNDHNREVTVQKWRDYAHMMTDGSWIENGETISVRSDGHLHNGQHRGLGARHTGKTIPFWFALGVSIEAYTTFDQHKKRGAREAYEVSKIPNAGEMARVVRNVFLIEDGTENARHETLSTNDSMALYHALDPRVQDCRTFVRNRMKAVYKTTGLAWPTLIALHYMFTGKDGKNVQAANEFFTVWASGMGARAPKWLVNNLMRIGMGSGHGVSHARTSAVVHAWNAFIRKEKWVHDNSWAPHGDIPKVEGY